MTTNENEGKEETPEEHRAFVDKIAGMLEKNGFEVETFKPLNDPRVLRVTPGDRQNRWKLDFNTSLTFELPVELSWFGSIQLNVACDAVEVELGSKRVTILPPLTASNPRETRFEIAADENGIIIDLAQVKLALLKALGMNVVIRRVTRGYHACDSCLESKAPRYYLFGLREGIDQLLCPACAIHRIASGRGKPSDIKEILEAI